MEGVFLMSEVPLYHSHDEKWPVFDPRGRPGPRTSGASAAPSCSGLEVNVFYERGNPVRPLLLRVLGLQGYLAHKKQPPARTLDQGHARGPGQVVLLTPPPAQGLEFRGRGSEVVVHG